MIIYSKIIKKMNMKLWRNLLIKILLFIFVSIIKKMIKANQLLMIVNFMEVQRHFKDLILIQPKLNYLGVNQFSLLFYFIKDKILV